jgi:hypothetical protein
VGKVNFTKMNLVKSLCLNIMIYKKKKFSEIAFDDEHNKINTHLGEFPMIMILIMVIYIRYQIF